MSSRLAGLVLVLAVLLSACAPATPAPSGGTTASAPSPSASVTPTPTPSGPVAVLNVGDCTGDIDLSGASMTSVPSVPCTEPHYYEVHASVPVTGDVYPGSDALASQAKTACSASFTAFVGVEAAYSRFSSAYLAPDEASWAVAANRVITCLVGSADGGLVGSAKGDTLIFPSKGQCTGPQDVAAQAVKIIDCASEHYYEVFAVKEVAGKKAPTESERQKLFTATCQAGFKSFVGIDVGKSKYEVTYFLAAADVWSKVGDHRIVCSAGSPKGGITGSLKGVKK